MNFGIGSFAYRWSIGRPYYRPEDPMTVDQLIDRCVKYLSLIHISEPTRRS